MSDWRESKLGSLTLKIGSGATPRGGSNSYKESGISLIRSQNVLDFKFTTSGLAFIDEEQADALRNVEVESNDVLLNITGDSVARCCIVPEYILPARVNQHVSIIRLDPRLADHQFIFYQLQFMKDELLMQSEIGATRKALTKGMIEDLDINLPLLKEQKAITAVLASLDDKIDLLHKQNKTLEALAQTLFRHWFIDGADDDWEKVMLQDICNIRRGSSPRPIQKYVENGTVPWIKIADATGSSSLEINKTKEFIIEAGVSKSVEVFPGDLILSNSATAGLPFFVGLYGCIHDGWLLFRDFTVPKNFIYFLLHFATAELNQMADGTVQKNLNTTLLKEYPFKLPSLDLLSEFDEYAELFIKKIKTNNTQIHTLENLRDTLLHKLMSGEVRINL